MKTGGIAGSLVTFLCINGVIAFLQGGLIFTTAWWVDYAYDCLFTGVFLGVFGIGARFLLNR